MSYKEICREAAIIGGIIGAVLFAAFVISLAGDLTTALPVLLAAYAFATPLYILIKWKECRT